MSMYQFKFCSTVKKLFRNSWMYFERPMGPLIRFHFFQSHSNSFNDYRISHFICLTTNQRVTWTAFAIPTITFKIKPSKTKVSQLYYIGYIHWFHLLYKYDRPVPRKKTKISSKTFTGLWVHGYLGVFVVINWQFNTIIGISRTGGLFVL